MDKNIYEKEKKNLYKVRITDVILLKLPKEFCAAMHSTTS